MAERVEVRNGRAFRVTTLPEAKPPKRRSGRTRYHYGEVGKPGEVGPSTFVRKPKPKPKKRG